GLGDVDSCTPWGAEPLKVCSGRSRLFRAGGAARETCTGSRLTRSAGSLQRGRPFPVPRPAEPRRG
ncbi:hypothetical protein NDU88_000392, partial [Pleurodeles waltl]